ncbi:PSD1 and planctomycete cytochrome C domain-containing protein [Rubripirellula reticaptiva]|uniref:Planctomycete cytochrome C n=1 Tax=Rubripirellula reticaptiva TaxID=2528013 RepID=A0A5C6FB49_9BACT|nr:PSD1 and planctomycete cytochrome C domain-containing protein [Rubripirellula reticaptiva]TWU57534.1 Planctomycete cytochrome C [Rubripirellula reticaptiva]
MHRHWYLVCLLAASSASIFADDSLDFNRDIRPLLSENCLICHGPDEEERAAGLRLDTAEGSREDLGGYAAIVPGDADASELLVRLTTNDEDLRMPPEGKGRKFTGEEIDRIRSWIEQGGDYAGHWSYEPLHRPALPSPSDAWISDWAKNPIDDFIGQRLVSEGLSPSPAADRLTLARRVSIDLTGLPPAWTEAKQFAGDDREDAYEAYVDRLLAKPSFGERWARTWLDLARYADSAGYADDPPRTIWAYRDYVIESLNQNKPFDQFTIEQIAGDLLDEPTDEQLIATAFHRNTTTNNEGGTNDEEFRNVAIVDRVNTTMAVWMGTTMACAQCHTHKFDPITHHDYFSFFAFFNNTEDNDQRDERPTIEFWTDAERQTKHSLQAKVDDLKNELGEIEKSDDAYEAKNKQLAAAKKKLNQFKPAKTVPVMRSVAGDKLRKTHIQIRGNYTSLGDEVSAATPAAFPSLPDDAPRDRLTLARWLVADNNPLTPRVIANRHWEEIFGTGIVSTSEEFGSQGELPSHPELLDWLAAELRDSGWDLKHLLRLLVTSATYRQSSVTTPAMVDLDPANRWLARGPRFRASAEVVRDQALFAAGILSDKMFGPPVNPPQPNLGLKAAFGGNTDWTTSDGDDRYRRGIYTMWRRSSPYPSMAQFDAPSRETCTVRRIRTNTPLQALVTLNDPVYVEAAQALARLTVASTTSNEDRITLAFERCLTRPPHEAEIARLCELVGKVQSHYQDRPDEANAMATQPLGELPVDADAGELAAWTVACNVILNLDEMLMKP